jgi:sugar phosphate isomerase/epimerase
MKGATEDQASCTLGTGSIDLEDILETARKNGMQYFIVEQERYDGTTPLKAIADDAAYMKRLKLG